MGEYQNTYQSQENLQKKMKLGFNSLTFQEMSWFASYFNPYFVFKTWIELK